MARCVLRSFSRHVLSHHCVPLTQSVPRIEIEITDRSRGYVLVQQLRGDATMIADLVDRPICVC